MRGTQKQIAWATEIRANVVKALEDELPEILAIAPNQAAAETAIKEIRSRIDRLNAKDVYAGDIISLFKDIRFRGDTERNFGDIMAVYRVTVPETATARALLGR